ncbi:MAG TPA: MarR family transcriptional regulator [Jiangellaceae bacterium]
MGERVLANSAWEALLSAHAVLMKEFAAEDVWQDVSMREYDVLYTLSKRDEPLPMSELYRHVLLSQPALSRMVQRLLDRELVERCDDPDDRRRARLSLTAAGREMQRRIGQRHARSVARAVIAELSVDEIHQLETIGRKLAGRSAGNDSTSSGKTEGART